MVVWNGSRKQPQPVYDDRILLSTMMSLKHLLNHSTFVMMAICGEA